MNDNNITSEDVKGGELYFALKVKYNKLIEFAESCKKYIIPSYIRDQEYIDKICWKADKKYNGDISKLDIAIKEFFNTGYIRNSEHKVWETKPIIKLGQTSDPEQRDKKYRFNTEQLYPLENLMCVYMFLDINGNRFTDKELVKILIEDYFVKFDKDNLDTESNSDEKINLNDQNDPKCPISKGKTLQERQEICVSIINEVIRLRQLCSKKFRLDTSYLERHQDRIVQRNIINELKYKITNNLSEKVFCLLALCRFGKTHVTLELCKELGFKRILITSNIVASEYAYKSDIKNYSDYNDYFFYSQQDIVEDDNNTIKEKLKSEKLVMFCSLPYLKSIRDEKKQKKIDLLLQEKFDIVIIDEFHSAGLTVRTLKYINTYNNKNDINNIINNDDDVINEEYDPEDKSKLEEIANKLGKVKRDYTLIVSATPENAKLAGLLNENNTVVFDDLVFNDHLMEESLDSQLLSELLIHPFIIESTYDPSYGVKTLKNLPEGAEYFDTLVPFDFKTFSQYDAVKKDFLYRYHVKDLFQKLFEGYPLDPVTSFNSTQSIFSFNDISSIDNVIKDKIESNKRYFELDNKRKHMFASIYGNPDNNKDYIDKLRFGIMIFVDGVGPAAALESILNDIQFVYKNYKIINIAGDKYCGSGNDALRYINEQKYIGIKEGKRGYIVLTCGKCIVGTTITDLGTIIRFDSKRSVPNYIQANMRIFSDCRDKKIGKYVKPYSLLLDLNIQRKFLLKKEYTTDLVKFHEAEIKKRVNSSDEMKYHEYVIYKMGAVQNLTPFCIKRFYDIEEIKKEGHFVDIYAERIMRYSKYNGLKVDLDMCDVIERSYKLGISIKIDDIKDQGGKLKTYWRDELDGLEDNNKNGIRSCGKNDKIETLKYGEKKKKKESDGIIGKYTEIRNIISGCNLQLQLALLMLMEAKNDDSKINSIKEYKNNETFVKLFNELCAVFRITFDEYLNYMNNEYGILEEDQINSLILNFENIYNVIKDNPDILKEFYSKIYDGCRIDNTTVCIDDDDILDELI